MKVRTLILFNDLQSNKIRKIGEVFEANQKRVDELNSTSRGLFVEVIENEAKPKKKKGD